MPVACAYRLRCRRGARDTEARGFPPCDAAMTERFLECSMIQALSSKLPKSNKFQEYRQNCFPPILGCNKIAICLPDCCCRQTRPAPCRQENADFGVRKQRKKRFLLKMLPLPCHFYTKTKENHDNCCRNQNPGKHM